MTKKELQEQVERLKMKLDAMTRLGENMKLEAGPGKIWVETEFGPALFLGLAHMLIQSKAENYLECRFDSLKALPNGATGILVTVCYRHGDDERTPAKVNAELKAEVEKLTLELDALRGQSSIPRPEGGY